MKRSGPSAWYLSPFLLPAFVVSLALSVYPVVQLVRMGVSEVGPTTILGDWNYVGLDNLRQVLANQIFWDAAWATVVFTGVLLISDLVVGFIAARILAKDSRLTNAVLSLMVFVWALPPLVSGSVWKYLLAGDGAINAVLEGLGIGRIDWLSSPELALLSVSLVAAWASIPFATLIIRGGILSIPREILEAAALDGAGARQAAVHILIPLLRPTLAALVILIILYAFRSFDFVYVMTQGGPGRLTTTLPYLAYQTSFKTFEFGTGAAIAMLSMSVIAVLAIPYVLDIRREQNA